MAQPRAASLSVLHAAHIIRVDGSLEVDVAARLTILHDQPGAA